MFERSDPNEALGATSLMNKTIFYQNVCLEYAYIISHMYRTLPKRTQTNRHTHTRQSTATQLTKLVIFTQYNIN